MKRQTAYLTPDALDIEAYQGDDFGMVLDLTDPTEGDPIDLTGSSFRFHIREAVADTGAALLADVPMTLDPDPTTGRVHGSIAASVMEGLSGAMRYDIEWTHSEGVRTLLAGRFVVRQEVTR